MAASQQRKGWVTGAASTSAATGRPKRRLRPSRWALVVVLLAALAGLALWLVPAWQVYPARERLAFEFDLSAAERLLLEKELFQAENSARSTLALILAASGLLLGLVILWRRFEASRELKSHEQFAAAVEQLVSERSDGSARTESRLAGVYALERLASESDNEYWPVLEVLTAYVRENAAWKYAERSSSPATSPRPSADIQAVMAVLGRRRLLGSTAERRLLDLREVDLRGANLSGGHFEGCTLQGSHLEHADATRAILTRSNLREASLAGASLSEADLEGASLARANLEGARLNGANLKGADLSGARLHGADLWEANLKGCNLKDADLRGADLSQAMLEGAILWRADLQDAVLAGATLRETHLERANLTGVSGLTWEQGEDAYTDENTILPLYLLPEEARVAAAARTPPSRRPVSPPPAPVAQEPARAPKPARRKPAAPSRPTKRGANVVDLKAKKTDVVPKKATRPKHRKQSLVSPG
jgi:uncharacterized protein YjbI with pentapeptide repeats